MIPRVKICGITSVRDGAIAAGAGAAAIGLVFWPSSPRHVDRGRAREIIASLPPFVSTVGVFVNQVDEARRIAADLRLSAVQLHGDESVDDCRGFGVPVIKAVAVRDRSAIDAALACPEEVTVLLDAHDAVKRGGTGTPIDWSIAAEIARERRIVLSGGLNAANVARAIETVRPWAIDVSSGVESAPGQKDAAKLTALFDTLFSVWHS